MIFQVANYVHDNNDQQLIKYNKLYDGMAALEQKFDKMIN